MTIVKVLEEIQPLNDANFSEARKTKARKTKLSNKEKRKIRAEQVTKNLKAKLGSVKWGGDVINSRDKIISSFMKNDPYTVIKMISGPNGYKVIGILRALEKAHGGYNKLLKRAGKSKDFVKKVYEFINEIEDM